MAEDELTKLRTENIRLRNELDKQANAWGGYVDAHAGNYSRMNARIAELEKTVARKNGALHALDVEVQQQSETIARLEADNRRLRHLDAMPLDALRRLVEYCEWTQSEEYPVNQHIADYNAAIAYFRKMDGAA